MAEPDAADSVRCPQCRRVMAVPTDWRLVLCPGCGTAVTRMDEDFAFD